MSRGRAFLVLLRPPNIVTALADIAAGFAISGRGNARGLPWLLLATACLYGGGVVLNDFFDRHLDAVERPERPIPSGRVKPREAALFGGALLAAGVLAALAATPEAAALGAAIAALVLTYDAWAKHQAFLGPIAMGGCRALNLMLGVAATPAALSGHWHLALLPFVYIVAITALSRGEVHGGSRAVAAFSLLSMAAVLAALVALVRGPAMDRALGLIVVAVLASNILPAFWRAYRTASAGEIRKAVRAGVLSLVLLDATLSFIFAGALYGAVVLAGALFAGGLARRFAVT